MTEQKYTKTAIVLHWLIAFAIFGMFALGWYMSDLPKEAPKQLAYDLFDFGLYTWQLAEEASPRTFYFNLHKSLGITLFSLILFRFIWRLTHRPPALLATLKAWERKLSTATHHTLYLLMILLPVSGIIMAVNSKYGIKWFGIELMGGLDNKGLRETFVEVHDFLGVLILLLIVVHIAGALKHKFIDKDGTASRMSLK